jgi:hypothetical protein
MDKKTLKQLAAIRERYTSLEDMAEALRAHPGFEDLNRSTLSRWLKNPPQRARVAVQILNSRRAGTRLRIAEPQALSVIPSSMLTWAIEPGKPYGLLEKQYGVVAEVQPTRHGGPALELLVKGKADVAIVPSDMLTQLGPDCRRVCLLSKLYVTGLATGAIDAVSDLKGKTFGIVAGSAFGTRLHEVSLGWGITLPQPLAFATPKDIVQALLARRIDGMVGSEPSVSHVGRAVGRSLQVFPIREGLLGWFEMHVAMNLRTARPACARAYLCGLREAVEYTNARKSVAAFQAEIASRYEMDQSDVRSILTNTTFSVGELEAAPVLTLWERETVELRKR